MRLKLGIAVAVLTLAGGAPAFAANEQGAVTDAAVCATVEGWNAFLAQWNIDLAGALTAGTLTPEIHDYIAGRADALVKAMSAKPTPAEMVQYCEYLNALFPR